MKPYDRPATVGNVRQIVEDGFFGFSAWHSAVLQALKSRNPTVSPDDVYDPLHFGIIVLDQIMRCCEAQFGVEDVRNVTVAEIAQRQHANTREHEAFLDKYLPKRAILSGKGSPVSDPFFAKGLTPRPWYDESTVGAAVTSFLRLQIQNTNRAFGDQHQHRKKVVIPASIEEGGIEFPAHDPQLNPFYDLYAAFLRHHIFPVDLAADERMNELRALTRAHRRFLNNDLSPFNRSSKSGRYFLALRAAFDDLNDVMASVETKFDRAKAAVGETVEGNQQDIFEKGPYVASLFWLGFWVDAHHTGRIFRSELSEYIEANMPSISSSEKKPTAKEWGNSVDLPADTSFTLAQCWYGAAMVHQVAVGESPVASHLKAALPISMNDRMLAFHWAEFRNFLEVVQQ